MKHKNPLYDQGGFTVIEVMLFLGISAMLVLVAILGTGSVIRSVRFTDSVRSAHGFVQEQYDEILNGVNPRDAAAICGAAGPVAAGKSDCLMLGKLIYFDLGTSDIRAHYVVSDIPDPADESLADASDTELISAVEPKVVKQIGQSEFTIPWEAPVFNSKRVGGDDKQVNAYALLRSPRSSRLVAYTFELPAGSLAGNGAQSIQSYVSNPANVQRATNFCIRSQGSADPPAAITVGAGGGQETIGVNFSLDDWREACQGN